MSVVDTSQRTSAAEQVTGSVSSAVRQAHRSNHPFALPPIETLLHGLTVGFLLDQPGAEVLAPGHTMPVSGAADAYEVLTTTHAAIIHVMHHTANGMNAGLAQG